MNFWILHKSLESLLYIQYCSSEFYVLVLYYGIWRSLLSIDSMEQIISKPLHNMNNVYSSYCAVLIDRW